MWILVLLILVDTIAGRSAVLDLRITVAGFPINVLDGLIVLGLIVAAIPMRRGQWEQIHPLAWLSILLFVCASAIGAFGGTQNGAELRWVVTPLRNLLVLPQIIFIAYRVSGSVKRIRFMFYVFLFASIASAVIAIFTASNTAGDIAGGSNFDELRSSALSLGGDLGCMAAAVLVYTLVSGGRVFWRGLQIPALIVCAIGILGVPHRNLWLAAIVTCAYAGFVLYRHNFFRKAGMGLMVVCVTIVAAALGIAAMSALTGRSYGDYVERRLLSILPNEHVAKENKPWETRLPGIIREIELWSQNPLLGRGFGIQDVDIRSHPFISGYRHNVWTCELVESGPIGLGATVIFVVGMIVVGYRMASDETSPVSTMMGVLGSCGGVWTFVLATCTMSLNTQEMAILIGSIFGVLMRARSLQLAGEDGPMYMPPDEPSSDGAADYSADEALEPVTQDSTSYS